MPGKMNLVSCTNSLSGIHLLFISLENICNMNLIKLFLTLNNNTIFIKIISYFVYKLVYSGTFQYRVNGIIFFTENCK